MSISDSLRKEIALYTLDGKFIKTWDSIKEASQMLSIPNISLNLIGASKYSGDFQWKYFNGDTSDIEPVIKKEKTVYLFDLYGNLINTWESITEASKQFKNNNSARVAISNNCLNKVNKAYGYYWSYKNVFNYKNTKKRAVAKYDDLGQFLEAYDSIKEAAQANNIKNSSNIHAAISGSQKKCGNFIWRYFDGNTSNIKL